MLRVAYLEPKANPEGPHAAATAEIVRALEDHVELTRLRPHANGRGLERVIRPKRFDRILGVFENAGDMVHGLGALRRHGGVAVLHGWELGSLAQAASPSLQGSGGLLGAFAAWRHGGTAEMRRWRAGDRGGLAFNRRVVRWADAFIVEERELAHRIQDERNAPTAVQFAELVPGELGAEETARRWAKCLEVLPAHRSGAKSLIATAIAGADAARQQRARE